MSFQDRLPRAAVAILGLCPIALGAAPQETATLDLTHDAYGTSSAGSGLFDLVPGASMTFEVTGPVRARLLLLASVAPALDSAPSVGGVPLAIDPASAFQLVPAGVIGLDGSAKLPLAVPNALPLGSLLHVQAFLLEKPSLRLSASPGLELRVDDLSPRTIDQGEYSGHPLAVTGGVLRIEDNASWAALWAAHTSLGAPLPVLPAIDFQREFVLAGFAGTFGNGGNTMEITGVSGDASVLIVHVELTVPGFGCPVTTVITRPYHIVRVSKVASVPLGPVDWQVTALPPCL